MKVHNTPQGSPEWHALRASHFTASEAPAMMGVSKYQTRSELLHQKATGLTADVGPAQQAIFDRGHATEAMARPLVEELIGDELFPIVASEGRLLASMDGADMLCDTLFEHKLWNEELAAQVRAGELDAHYYWQLEQQLLVTGARRVIFVCSDGTSEKFVHMEYRPVPGRAGQLIAGWAQFADDLAAYTPPPVTVEAVASPVESLPAVSVRMEGSIAVISNLDLFGAKLQAFVERIDRAPSTDQAFADAEAAIKTLQTAQDALEQAEAAALAQTASIEQMRRTVADYTALARSTRLALEKIVKARKEQIKVEIVTEARNAFEAHIAGLNKRLGKPYMPVVATDFAGVIKGKRTLASLRDAVDTELARAKIEANAIGDRIQFNMQTLRDMAGEHAFLFADSNVLVLKANDDLRAVIGQRLAEHEAAEVKRLEAERERIRQEEQRKLEAATRQQMRLQEASEGAPLVPAELATAAAAIPLLEQAVELACTMSQVEQAVDQEQGEPLFKLGDFNSRLGFALTGDFVKSLGIEPVGRERTALLYRASDFNRLCLALIAHIQRSQHAALAA